MPDYDSLLVGQYIKQLENPRSLGLVGDRWYASPYDKNARGYGIDVVYNDNAARLVRGRKGKWLTVDEEKELRNRHIQSDFETLERTFHPALTTRPLSERKKLMGVGLLYRGDGINVNPKLSDAYYAGSDADFQEAVRQYYLSKNLPERAKQHQEFMESHSAAPVRSVLPPINWAESEFHPGIQHSDGGQLQKHRTWNDLSLEEKSDMIRVAVKNGITSLDEIRQRYNEFAGGGDTDGSWTMEDEAGYRAWRETLPANLRNTDDNRYDMRAAYKSGAQPQLYDDGYYHLPSRDPRTGMSLKSLVHPTHTLATVADAMIGYHPYMKNGREYTDTWEGNDRMLQRISLEKPPVPYAFGDGGSIHIAPSREGTFTTAATKHGKSVQEFASQVLSHPENYSPAMRKKANFARNSAKWHGLGGPLVEAAMAHKYDGTSEDSQQMNIMPWQVGWMLDEEAQMVEDERHPKGRFLQEITITAPYISDSQRMKNNLQENIARAEKKNAFDAYRLQRNINQAQDDFARDFGLNLFGLMGGSPLTNAAVMTGMGTVPELGEVIGGNKGRKIGSYISMAAPIAPVVARGAVAGNRVITSAIKDLYNNGTLWDSQTTFKGRLGNYSDDLFTNIYATAARRYGLPDRARIPADAIRKIKEDINLSNDKVDFTGNKNFSGKPHTNFTLDRPVVSHKWGWDGADTYLTPLRNIVKNNKNDIISIEPSDMFVNGSRITESPGNVTLISGDVDALTNARKMGMQTLSSPHLRRMYSEALNKHKANPLLTHHPKQEQYWKDYADEIQRLQAQRGIPTLQDFRLLENQLGMESGVSPVSDYKYAVNELDRMLRSPIRASLTPYTYPNGRIVDFGDMRRELERLQRAKYNNVFYDPASWVEFNWRSGLGL